MSDLDSTPGLGFEKALAAIKNCQPVFRSSWGEKGRNISLLKGTEWDVFDPCGEPLPNLPFIVMEIDGYRVPWTPTQSDLLAEDWKVAIKPPSPALTPIA